MHLVIPGLNPQDEYILCFCQQKADQNVETTKKKVSEFYEFGKNTKLK